MLPAILLRLALAGLPNVPVETLASPEWIERERATDALVCRDADDWRLTLAYLSRSVDERQCIDAVVREGVIFQRRVAGHWERARSLRAVLRRVEFVLFDPSDLVWRN